MILDGFFLNERAHCQSPSKMVCEDFDVFAYTRAPLQNRGTQDSKKPLFCQNMLPHSTYAFRLFRVVDLAPNLKALEIRSANLLDLDTVAFPPSLRLRTLDLGGVSFSRNPPLTIINQSASETRDIRFQYVKLKFGTWHQVLLQMCNLSKFFDITTDCCVYLFTGSSSI